MRKIRVTVAAMFALIAIISTSTVALGGGPVTENPPESISLREHVEATLGSALTVALQNARSGVAPCWLAGHVPEVLTVCGPQGCGAKPPPDPGD